MKTEMLSLLGAFIFSLFMATAMSEHLAKKEPQSKPFRWGYFFVWMGGLVGAIFSVAEFAKVGMYFGARAESHAMAGLYLAFSSLIHFAALGRNKWLISFATILQLNPILWIVNGFYLKNRWLELPSFTIPAFAKKVGVDWRKLKIFLGCSFLWCIAVLLFVSIFKPYGEYMFNSDKQQVFKIIVFTPLFLGVSYFFLQILFRSPDNNS